MKIERVRSSKTLAFRITKKNGQRRIYSRHTVRFRLPKLPKLEKRDKV